MFEGIVNFRDPGGLPLRRGGRVRKGRLYRSADLSRATDADLARLTALDLGVLADLRRFSERNFEPDRLPEGFAARIIVNPDPQAGDPPHIATMRQFTGNPDLLEEMVLTFYRRAPLDPHLMTAMRDVVSALATSDKPVLVHCSAGKDRTGIITALLFEMLGVEEEAIMVDYLASQDLVTGANLDRLVADLATRLDLSLPPSMVARVYGVDAIWLQAARQTMIEHAGSVAAYGALLGLEGATLESLRQRLVEA